MPDCILIKKIHFENADMSALSFAMTIHGLMDYELDQKYGKNAITISSILISMTAVLYFSMIRETYCVVIVFLQLMIKVGLLFYAIGKVGMKKRKDA